MKYIRTVFGLFVAAIFISSCKKNISVEAVANFDQPRSAKHLVSSSSVVQRINFDSLRTTLPSTANARLKKSKDLLSQQNPEFGKVVAKLLYGAEAMLCTTTPLNTWLSNQLLDWDSDVYNYAVLTGMINLPTYYALYVENSPDRKSYGVNDEYTHTYEKTFKDLKRFWDIPSSNIVTVPINGSMLQSRDKIIQVNKLIFGNDDVDAEYWADLISWLLANVPQYQNGDHPIFSFNAYSQPSFYFYPIGMLPPKIAIGDGLISAYVDLGFGDVAPQAIFAHEFAHQVQFQNDVYAGNTAQLDFTRRAELMADALAAYYLSHARGASMQWKRVEAFLEVFYNIGDCNFTSYTHHGTPDQRMAAAEWGYHLANDAQKQGHILTSRQVIALFDASLSRIL